jgi:ABC-2 type transport system permease protein
VVTLRERRSGTLERLLSMPLGKLDLLLGYGLAFALVAIVQAVLASALMVWVLDLSVAGATWLLVVVAVVDAVLGCALGLFVSAFARTEFQAVQFLPAVVLPQLLLCGLLVPRDQLEPVLEAISDALPLSYAVDAMQRITVEPDVSARIAVDIGIVLLAIVLALTLGAATLRRRTA